MTPKLGFMEDLHSLMLAYLRLLFLFSLYFGATILMPVPALAVDVCYPPEEPFIPASDEELMEYADLIDEDFQRYFKEITEYFTCMDRTRQQAFEEARAFSGTYNAFLKRLDSAHESGTVIPESENGQESADE